MAKSKIARQTNSVKRVRNSQNVVLHISEHSDHPFRDYTIADFAIIRSPIPRFSGHF